MKQKEALQQYFEGHRKRLETEFQQLTPQATQLLDSAYRWSYENIRKAPSIAGFPHAPVEQWFPAFVRRWHEVSLNVDQLLLDNKSKYFAEAMGLTGYDEQKAAKLVGFTCTYVRSNIGQYLYLQDRWANEDAWIRGTLSGAAYLEKVDQEWSACQSNLEGQASSLARQLRVETEDVLQDCYEQIRRWVLANPEKRIGTVEAFARTILRNRATDVGRRNASHPQPTLFSELSGDSATDDVGLSTRKAFPTSFEVIEKFNTEQLLAHLDPLDQEIWRLRAKGFRVEDIAQFLHEKPGTISAHYRRARIKLLMNCTAEERKELLEHYSRIRKKVRKLIRQFLAEGTWNHVDNLLIEMCLFDGMEPEAICEKMADTLKLAREQGLLKVAPVKRLKQCLQQLFEHLLSKETEQDEQE